MIKLVVAGANGRMGKTLLTLAHSDSVFKIHGALERSDSPTLGQDVGALIGSKALGVEVRDHPSQVLKDADVLIDFTQPSVAESHLEAAVQAKTAYVLGTTGLEEGIYPFLEAAAKKIPIVQSPNMSIGVNVLFKLAEITARALNHSYDIEIVETHHRNKKDSPSGTALKLLEIVAGVRKKNLKRDVVYGRQGQIGARPQGQIGVLALRGGDVVGDHVLSFLGDGERIELIHRASSREAFAQGALRAAKFVAQQKSGLYNMQQVLGIS